MSTEITTTDELEIVTNGLLQIKQGIQEGNWQIVCDGYNYISGEALTPKIESKKTSLKGLRDALRNQGITRPKDQPEVQVKTDDSSKVLEDVQELVEKAIKIPVEVTDSDIKEEKAGKQTVISAGFDPEEAKANELLNKKKPKVKVSRSKPPTDNSQDEDAAIRFHQNPSVKPPWS